MNFLISSLTSGGAERVVSSLANEMCKKQDVTIYTISDDVFYKIDQRVKIVPIGRSKLVFINIIYTLFFLYKKVKSKELLNLQSHMFYSNYIAGLLSFIFPSFEVTMVHCVAWDSKFPKGTLKRYIHMILMFSLYRFADKHIFKSSGMKYSYGKIIDTIKSSIIYNPIDIELINNSYHIPFSHQDEVIRILSVGRFHRSKRQMDLLKALKNVDFKFELVFLGDGNLLSATQDFCQELGLDKSVSFVGNVKNPYEFYSWADIYVSCSESEGFPNSLVEALGCGCVAIHSDCVSGPDEILIKSDDSKLDNSDVLDCQYGYLYPVGDTHSLAYALTFVVNNKQIAKDKACGFFDNEVVKLDIASISKSYMN